MHCEPVRRELNGFIDDQLPGAVARDVEQHLAMCESCQAHVARMRRLDDVLSDFATIPVPDGFVSRVLGAARRRATAARPRGISEFTDPPAHGGTRIRVLDAVAGVILVLGFSLGTWMARHTWGSTEAGYVSSGATRGTHDIGSFYGADFESVEIQRTLPLAYLTFVDRSASGE